MSMGTGGRPRQQSEAEAPAWRTARTWWLLEFFTTAPPGGGTSHPRLPSSESCSIPTVNSTVPAPPFGGRAGTSVRYNGPVGFNNPGVPWNEIERRLSDRGVGHVPSGPRPAAPKVVATRPGTRRRRRGGENGLHGPVRAGRRGAAAWWATTRWPLAGGGGANPGDGGGARPGRITARPTRLRTSCGPGADGGGRGEGAKGHMPSCTATRTSSFLDGASHPEELVEEAARLGLEALAITDHDGFYGVVRFAEAARAVGLPTVFGAELTLDGAPARRRPRRRPTPTGGEHLRAPGPRPGRATPGWPGRSARPSWRGRRARPRLAPRRAGRGGLGPARGRLGWCSPAAARGRCPRRWSRDGPAAAGGELRPAGRRVRAEHTCRVELWDHGDPLDRRPQRRPGPAWRVAAGVDVVATNNVHYATPAQRALATALAAVRARRSLDEIDGWLPGRRRRPPALGRRAGPALRPLPRRGGARRGELGRACAFDLPLVAPDLPPYPCPAADGAPLTEMALPAPARRRGAPRRRYGPPATPERVRARAWRQIDHELDVIEALGFPGYFLVVWDIVEFCRRDDIYCQGRGSRPTARSATRSASPRPTPCALGLLFERFLSPERDGPPDIDLDIESGRREEVIQYVYERYGRDYAGAGGQRHHLPGPLRGPRHGQGARLRTRPAGRLVEAGRPLGRHRDQAGRCDPTAPAEPTVPDRRCSSWPPRSRTSPATSASTRAAW